MDSSPTLEFPARGDSQPQLETRGNVRWGKVLGQGGFRKQMTILLIIIAGIFIIRAIIDPQHQEGSDLTPRVQEIRSFWNRIEGYPDAAEIDAKEATGADYIVSERLYATNAPYEHAIAFYDKHLPSIGWEVIGEQKDWPGHISPIRIYRHRSYHLLVNSTAKGVLLRITWSANLDPKADIRLIPE